MTTGDKTNWPLVARCLQGNQDALLFLQHLNHVANVWDDLVDGDMKGDDPRVAGAFESALVHIPRNPFFRAHFHDLQPIVETSISAWLAANQFEVDGSDEALARAHMLRFSAVHAFVMCARLIGGQEWADQCAVDLWMAYPQEQLPKYMEEIRHDRSL